MKKTEWFDGQTTNPGQSGVYQIRCGGVGGDIYYSHFCRVTKKWNGGWASASIAHSRRSFFKTFGYGGLVDRYLATPGHLHFRGLVVNMQTGAALKEQHD